jgi:hypothetical protein
MTLRVRSHRFERNTVQGPPPPAVDGPDRPLILGFPAEVEDDDDPGEDQPPGPAVRLVAARRADPVAGGLLLLAGGATAASLWLPWAAGGAAGESLVRRGLEVPGIADLLAGTRWPPVAVVAGGAALLLVCPLLFRPARTHRVAGVLALVAAAPAAAGVLLLCADARWDTERFGAGLWCAVAVAGLGLLGALKAMLTLPRVTAAEDQPQPAPASG